MRTITVWIWFIGSVAWLVDAGVSLHFHDRSRASLVLCVSFLFLGAGIFYSRQGNRRR